jgi:CubicO group peptidase (beta-lactamase class C family)
MKRLLLSLTLGLVTAISTSAQDSKSAQSSSEKISDAAIRTELEPFLEKLVAEDKFSGVVLVAKDFRPIFGKAYGMANIGSQVRNRTDTRFNVGSMSKMFTAVAIAQLVERGKLSFSDSVGKHLPDYTNKAVASKVTIHQLLTHTSGMGDYQNENFYAQLDQMKTVSNLLPLFVNDPLTFEPGTKWEYSNSAYVVLGLIIEKISGQSYFDYVKQNVFKPAGMNSTDFYARDENVPNRARGYMKVNDQGDPDPSAPRRENTSARPAKGSPAGGAYSTVTDMLEFHRALVNDKLLSQKYTDIVTTAKAKVPPGWPMSEYGYGFTISVINGKRIVGHGGAGPGVAGKFDMYPELGYTVIILSNYELPAIMPVIMKTRGLLLQ